MNISTSQPRTIQRLDENTANRIAAGEVIERPAAAVKELVENAIDAGASSIRIRFQNGGKTLIEVRDNGHGIHPDELQLAVERHATSKLKDGRLDDISSFGFRGEALPSIGAVARLEIQSRRQGHEAKLLRIAGGRLEPIAPATQNIGTLVRVRDLFYATPARLKFQGSDRAEAMAITDIVKRMAMARPDIAFTLEELREQGSRQIFSLPPAELHARLEAVLGKNKLQDALELDAKKGEARLAGFIGLPTAATGSAQGQYFFVNNRPVRDKIFFGAVKGAYVDLLPAGKFPFTVLYLELDAQEIDVNVHPAKTEIRFRQAGDMRSFILNAIRHRLAESGNRADHGLSAKMLASFGGGEGAASHFGQYQMHYQPRPSSGAVQASLHAQFPSLEEAPRSFAPAPSPDEHQEEHAQNHPLGLARAHIFENYIIAEAADGLVIVDGHAAHERITYERLKTQYREKRIQSQRLLVPEIINLAADERQAILNAEEEFAALGLEVEAFGVDAIAVHALPSLIAGAGVEKLIRDILDTINEDVQTAISARIDHVLATIACHHSVRSGRKLRIEEMNALLRDMESTPNSGSCNHGRPTLIKLDLKALQSRFGR